MERQKIDCYHMMNMIQWCRINLIDVYGKLFWKCSLQEELLSRKQKMKYCSNLQTSRSLIVVNLRKDLESQTFEEVRLDQSSVNKIKIIIQELLEDARGTWSIMKVIYKKQDQKIRDQLRGILKMLKINVSMFN